MCIHDVRVKCAWNVFVLHCVWYSSLREAHTILNKNKNYLQDFCCYILYLCNYFCVVALSIVSPHSLWALSFPRCSSPGSHKPHETLYVELINYLVISNWLMNVLPRAIHVGCPRMLLCFPISFNLPIIIESKNNFPYFITVCMC